MTNSFYNWVKAVGFMVSVCVASSTQIAFAGCEKDFSGTYVNKHGEKFLIEQPSCDYAVVTDLQTRKASRLRTDGSDGNLGDTTMDESLYFLKEFHWSNNYHSVSSTFQRNSLPGVKTFSTSSVHYRTRSDWSESNINFGLWSALKWEEDYSHSNLTLAADLEVFKDSNSLTIQVCNVDVNRSDDASLAEKAIAVGANGVLKTVKAAMGGCFYREVLTLVP